MIFALCGGDGRAVRLSAQLLEAGHTVRVWALEGAPLPERARKAASAAGCCAGADCVILPMPVTKKRGFLTAPYAARPVCLVETLAAMEPGTRVFAGGVSRELAELAAAQEVRVFDYSASESFRAANSAATAEGAVGVLLGETEGLVSGLNTVILGSGHITHALAPRLSALGARVTVMSRSAAERAFWRSSGMDSCDAGSLTDALGNAGAVINTAPALVLTASRLIELPAGALVLDLASAPGGVDFDAARAFGIRCVTAPGLPGKWAPEAAARAVYEAIFELLEAETSE